MVIKKESFLPDIFFALMLSSSIGFALDSSLFDSSIFFFVVLAGFFLFKKAGIRIKSARNICYKKISAHMDARMYWVRWAHTHCIYERFVACKFFFRLHVFSPAVEGKKAVGMVSERYFFVERVGDNLEA